MRALNLIPELRGLSYQDQLVRTKLPTLAYRRFRGDMIEVFKHLHTYDKAVLSASFRPNQRHPDRLIQSHSNSELQRSLFYFRIQELWNALPAACRDLSITIDTFKNRFDKHWAGLNLPLILDHRAGLPTRLNLSNSLLEAPWSSRTG